MGGDMQAVWTGKAVTKNKWHTVMRGTNRIIKTTAYRKFEESLIACFVQQKKIYSGKVEVVIKMSVNARTDHHNLLQPILDALEKAKVVSDDRFVSRVLLLEPERHGPKEDDRIMITVKECTQ
jgi:Holliday junction resolvase RusA-like endonuclease